MITAKEARDNLPPNSKLVSEIQGLEDFKDYSISNLGIVYSCKGYGEFYKKEWHILSQRIGTTGYYIIDFQFKKKSTTQKVHRLLGELFIPNPDNKPQINHKDGNKLNNSIENLEWVTCKENIHHSIKNELRDTAWGDRLPHACISNNMIETIFHEKIKGKENKELAVTFSVAESVIQGIISRRTYKHVYVSEDIVIKAKEINKSAKKRNWNKQFT